MPRPRLKRALTLAAALVAAAGTALAGTAATAQAQTQAGTSAQLAAAIRPAAGLPGAPAFGPDVYVFTPAMPQSQIQATVNAIAAQQVPNQFGTQRYALLFEPGTYGSAADPLIFQVGYYTEVAGLGTSPGDVTINGSVDVYNQCFGASNCIALDNFWRSLSNLTINVTGQSGCQASTEFWAVSQAAPVRRVDINGKVSLMDYCNGSPDYASGGFIADSNFTGSTVINGSQQQFVVRNSNLDGWSNAVWNQVFCGDPGAPAQSFASDSGDPGGPNSYTTLATCPVTEEAPFLQVGAGGQWSVFVPSVQDKTSGTSWSATTSTPGTAVPVSRFFIASPASDVTKINKALAAGENLIFSPGVYHLNTTIRVLRANTVVLGLGFATLVPQHGIAAIQVAGVPGVRLSGLIIDAGRQNSRYLVRIGGPDGETTGRFDDPTLLSDVFFRIGGATPGRATASLVVNSSHVILDDIWAWRADHGAGVGWTDNVADTGVVVNGNWVTAYGLAVEHYEKYQVIWNGQHGEDIFFQNEMPYDPPSQAAWMASKTQDGYPAFLVTRQVTSFQGYGLASYCFFEEGIPIESATAFQVPTTPGVQLHDLLTVFLSGSGGIEHVVDKTGAAVNEGGFGGPSDVVSYP
jgi:hypothetical protein